MMGPLIHCRRCTVHCGDASCRLYARAPNLLRELLDACDADGVLDEQTGRAIERRHLNQQLDTDGRLHDLAPEHERLRLFEPAPTQLAGQQYIDTDNEED